MQAVGLVKPERVQLGPRVPVAVLETARVKVTVPVGAVGPALVSVTVAVQVEAWFTTTVMSQETLVLVERAAGALTMILAETVVLLAL